MIAKIPYPTKYPITISLRLTGVASNLSKVPLVRSLNKAIPETKNTKKKTKKANQDRKYLVKKELFAPP